MQKQIYLAIVCCVFNFLSNAQTPPSILNQRALGGSRTDIMQSIRQTKDSGFILAGGAESVDGQVKGNHGGSDYWVVKMNRNRQVQWTKAFGGSGYDFATDVQQTPDGGYIVVGYSGSGYGSSPDGDVTGHHTGSIFVTSDYWVVKLDSTGNLQWQKSLGGKEDDFAYSVVVANDSGYIVAGSSKSADGDVTGNHGGDDYWIVKLNGSGKILWQKSLGGRADDIAFRIIKYGINGYVVAGAAASTNADVTGNHGDFDFWIVKLRPNGNIISQKCFGGSKAEMAFDIKEIAGNGLVVAGRSQSSNGDLTSNKGNEDYWIIKLNGKDNLIWQSSFGGGANDNPRAIQQTNDGGYIVGGSVDAGNGDIIGSHGSAEAWIIKLNTKGKLQWQKCLGGTGSDYCYSLFQNSKNEFIVGGASSSTDGNVKGNHGDYDYWMVTLSPETVAANITTIENKNAVAAGNDITIKAGPNPVIATLRIQSDAALKNGTVRISDLNGNLAYKGSLNIPAHGSVDLPVNTLRKGTYIVEVMANSFKKSFTIIKQ